MANEQQMLLEAIEHHKNGRLQQAEAGYRQVLQQRPDHPDALNLLGVIALQAGQPKIAADLIGRSVTLAPTSGSLNNLGEALRHLGRLDDAIASYRRSIQMQPQQLDAYINMAHALERQNKHAETAEALGRAASLAPQRIDLHGAEGSAWARAGDGYKAAAAFRRVLAIDSQHAAGHAHLAMALTSTGTLDDAKAAVARALELAPNSALSHGANAILLERLGQREQAVEAFGRAAQLNPKDPEYFGHRGTILENLNRFDEAQAVYEEGCRNIPTEPRLFNNLSNLLRRRRRYAESLERADTAIQLAPGFSDAHGNRALAFLSLGDYERGFEEYEWRWRCDSFTTAPRDFGRPMWDGSDPAGRRILVHSEQGFGDTIQFARYLSILADRGATVLVECHHSLRKLMASVRGVSRVITSGLALPDFDLHLPLLSLPRSFATTLENVPRDVPYLHVDPDRLDHWRQHVGKYAAKMKVGLIWAGNAKPEPRRTLPPDNLKALAGISGVRLFSLQRPDAGTYSAPPPELELIDLAPELTDFHETAAAMSALDLIITIDTGPAHLAGALGLKTWTLLVWSPDWRWLLDRDDTPWYPTMRLFRQSHENEWGDVLQSVRGELEKLAALTMRLFTAISISEEARRHLHGIQHILQDIDEMIGHRVTWLQPANMHVTLKFLGEVKHEVVPELQKALRGIPIEPMRLMMDRLECFPPRGPIRVIAAGVGGDAGGVHRLFEQIETVVEAFDIGRESRVFTPHVTLARCRDGIRRRWEHVVADRFPGPAFDAVGFELVKSALTAAGSQYETIEKFLSS